MKIGVVIYSWSGNTASVGEKLKAKLESAGHAVELAPVTVAGERAQGARDFELGPMPELSSYDGIVFGAAVEAFSLSPVFKTYLDAVESLAGKKVACLVTQQFPFPWMGGNNAIRQMKKRCSQKGALVLGNAVVNWAGSRRAKTTTTAVESLARLF